MRPPPPPEVFADVAGDDDPDAIDPREEGRGPFLPYRGNVDHGVPYGDMEDSGPQGYGDGSVGVVYDDPAKKDPVVNVRIVPDDTEQFKAFRVQTITVMPSQPAMQLLPRMRTRTRAAIQSVVGSTCFLSDNANMMSGPMVGGPANEFPMASWRMTVGSTFETTSTESIYVFNAGTTATTINVWIEYIQDI
jgi:hypothetical protein